jgi:hypothetical protein
MASLTVSLGGRDPGATQCGDPWWYREYAKEQSPEDRTACATAEEEARTFRGRSWREPEPIPP